MLPEKLRQKLAQRRKNDSIRTLKEETGLIDFSSNDYLGFTSSEKIYDRTLEILKEHRITSNGSGGSRLLTGNHQLYSEAESFIANFHNSEEALIFNSGYNANLGLFSAIPRRGDLILYDELVHASIRDGIQLSHAKGFKFRHNDIADLKEVLKRNESDSAEVYIVTESVFSMDGDSPDLIGLAEFCEEFGCHLIVDEAHAVGVMGSGKGLVCDLNLEDKVFGRLVTFGKALGSHGAAILGGVELKNYLINFARSLIYTTALPPHSLANIIASYELLKAEKTYIQRLNTNIAILRNEISQNLIRDSFIKSNSAIQCCIVQGNAKVKEVSHLLSEYGFDVRPILPPTVPVDQERLRICLHVFNSDEEIKKMVSLLAKHLNS